MIMKTKFDSRFNLIKLTLLSYFLTFVTGAIVVLPFVLKSSAAKYFHSNLEHVGYSFSFFMFGMIIFQFLNSYVIKLISIRAEIILMAITHITVSCLLFFVHNLVWIIPLFILLGFVSGMANTLAHYIIVHIYNARRRTSKLNFLDFSFSIGSFAYPMIAAFMLNHGLSWQSVYISIVFVFIIIVLLSLITKLPSTLKTTRKNAANVEISGWNINVILVGIAVFFYFMSYSGYRYWLSEYLVKDLHMSLYSANFGLSLFWIWYAIGCFLSGFMVKKFSTSKYIIISTLISTATYFLIYYSVNVAMMYIGISILGLATSTVYSSSVGYAAQLSESPSPKIISFIIVLSGIGSYFSEMYSSWVCGHIGLRAVTLSSAILMLASSAIYIYISFNKPKCE